MKLLVARIGKPHGIAGETTVEVFTDAPERRFHAGNVLTSDEFEEFIIKSSRFHNGRWLISFEGISDRDQVEKLRGKMLNAEVDIDEESEDGSFHVAQLIGLKVIDSATSRDLGKILDVINLPGQDLLSVKSSDGEILIPMVHQIVQRISLDEGKIFVTLPQGLVE
jgi:16S rRNA processing protein RimM